MQRDKNNKNDFILLISFSLDFKGPATGSCSGRHPCVPLVYCAAYFDEVRANGLGCYFYNDAIGACCRDASRGKFLQIAESAKLYLTFTAQLYIFGHLSGHIIFHAANKRIENKMGGIVFFR